MTMFLKSTFLLSLEDPSSIKYCQRVHLTRRCTLDQRYEPITIKENLRGLLSLTSPIERGIVENVDDMFHIWEYVYTELKVQRKDVRLEY